MTVESRFRLGVNLLWLRPGVVGGSERYIITILRDLAGRGDDMNVVLYALPAFTENYPELAAMFATRTAPVSGSFRPLRVAAENVWLPRAVRADGVDVMYHAGGTMPRKPGPRPVLTLHDLQYLDLPEFVSPVKRWWLNRVVPRSARRATMVITSSSHAKARIISASGIDPERILVIPHAVARPDLSPEDLAAIALPTSSPYVYFPAWTHPHKNHEMLIMAIASVPELHLVTTGGRGAHHDSVLAAVADLGLESRVHILGHVHDAHVEALYAGALAVAFPSSYEGFGAPVAEAMVRGVPVVSSSATSLSEVVGDGGILLDDEDVAAWTHALRSLLDDDVLADLGRRSVNRGAAFSPSASVDSLIAMWAEVASGS